MCSRKALELDENLSWDWKSAAGWGTIGTGEAKRMRILIVEDEKEIVRFVKLELEHEGYEAAAARTQAVCSFIPRQPLDFALKHFVLLLVIANAIRCDQNSLVHLVQLLCS